MTFMMGANLGTILYMFFTARDEFDFKKPETYNDFEKLVCDKYFLYLNGAGMLATWFFLVFRLFKQPLAQVPCVNVLLILLLMGTTNSLLMYLSMKIGAGYLLTPGILCVILGLFMWNSGQLILDRTFQNKRHHLLQQLDNAGNSSYTALSFIFMFSMAMIFMAYGFGIWGWLMVLIVMIEICVLVIDTS